MIKEIKNLEIKINYSSEKIKLPEEINSKIKSFWQDAVSSNPNIWDGDIVFVSNFEINDKEMIITSQKSNFSHYLYCERIGLDNQYACSNLAGGCILETSDGYYVVGELAANTSYPYCLQLPGGNVDHVDIKDGKIDIYNTIIRECEEELNIQLYNTEQVTDYGIMYIILPEKIRTYMIFSKCKLKMNKEEMQEHYQKYYQHLLENNLEIEFSNIHFIQKEFVEEELSMFTNPKRLYLEDLLLTDSKNQ